MIHTLCCIFYLSVDEYLGRGEPAALDNDLDQEEKDCEPDDESSEEEERQNQDRQEQVVLCILQISR